MLPGERLRRDSSVHADARWVMPVLRDAIKAPCEGHWFWRRTFGSRTGTRHVVHRSGSCSARHKGREARLLTHDRGVRTVASRWVPRRPNGDDQRRDADPFPRDQPFRWPALGATSGPANRTAGSNASAMLATWIRFALRRGRSGDTVPAPARSMNPARTLVDVKKSVETKPNFPPGILLRELPSGRTLGVLLHGALFGTAPDRSWPPLELPLGVTPPGAFLGTALHRVHRWEILSGIIW